MKISIRKTGTIYRKDIVDYLKNPALCMATVVPVLFVLLYRYLEIGISTGDKQQWLLNIGMLINTTMGGLMISGTSIAEEKEKHTLRTLRLSNVSGVEFCLAKILSGFTLTFAGGIIIFFITGVAVNQFPVYLICTFLGGLSVIMLSAWMGLVSRDQMTCGVYQVPIMLLVIMPGALGGMNKIMEKLAEVTPMSAMVRMYHKMRAGGVANEYLGELAVILIWSILGAVLFGITYHKQEVDN